MDEIYEIFVAMIIEKTLLNANLDEYHYVRKRLQVNQISFRDCYKKPELLRQILSELYDGRYSEIAKKILDNIDDIKLNTKLATFVKVINN